MIIHHILKLLSDIQRWRSDSHDNDTKKLHQDPTTSHHAVSSLDRTTSSTQITRCLSHFERVTGFNHLNRADAEECLSVLAIELPELERASEAALEDIERGAIKACERLHNLYQHASGIDNLLHKVFAFTGEKNNNNEFCRSLRRRRPYGPSWSRCARSWSGNQA